MRIVLINIQVAVLLTMAFLVMAAGGSFAGLGAVGAGAGPAALGAVAYLVVLLGLALAGLVVYVIPLSVVSGFTLLFALAAGWRPLRMLRFFGVFANLCGILYFVGIHMTEYLPPSFAVPFALLFTVNILLLLLMPRRPSLTATKILASTGTALLYLLPVGAALMVMHRDESTLSASTRSALHVILLVYLLPFLFNWFAVSAATGMSPGRIVWKLGVSTLVSAAALALAFPLGLPLALSTLLLYETLEISLLYPPVHPPRGSVREWIARIFGELPEGAVSLGQAIAPLAAAVMEKGRGVANRLGGFAASGGITYHVEVTENGNTRSVSGAFESTRDEEGDDEHEEQRQPEQTGPEAG